MLNLFALLKYIIFQTFGLAIALIAGGAFVYLVLRKLHSQRIALTLFAIFFGIFLFFFVPRSIPSALQFPFLLQTFGPADGPGLPLSHITSFFFKAKNMQHVQDIAHQPTNIPAPLPKRKPTTVHIDLEAREVLGEIAPGIAFNYWTFNGTVPGPMIRVREGDTVELTLKNSLSNVNHHNIDLHAVTGPGGGATVTNIMPGESKTLRFLAQHPGLFIYHCGHPNAATHTSHGMYGMILVEPKEGLPKVDREFYVMQGEFYSTGPLGSKGLQVFDAQKMLDAKPEYVVFNGRTKSVTENMHAKTGEKIRLFFGNAGVNFLSSLHVIGEVFDTVYPEASVGGALFKNVQSTVVPAGGATIVEFGVEVPGRYVMVDHALARLDRGAWGILQVRGDPRPDIFDGTTDANADDMGH